MESESFGIDAVKAEKANAMRRFNRLRKIGNVVRILEACALLILLSWSSARFQSVPRVAGEYARQLAAVLNNPGFVFLIWNAIVLAVVAKSRLSDDAGDRRESSSAGVEIAGKVDLPDDPVAEGKPHPPEERPAVTETEQVKSIVSVENAAAPLGKVTTVAGGVPPEAAKRCRRTQSESFERDIYEAPPPRDLRRSETMGIRRESGNRGGEMSPAVDDLSNEEFRLTVEAFINKNRLFMRKESMAVVVTQIEMERAVISE